MQFYDICTKRTYTDKNGNEKTTWLKAGSLKVTDSGKQFIELNMMPDTTFYVFEQKQKEKQLPVTDLSADPLNQIDLGVE